MRPDRSLVRGSELLGVRIDGARARSGTQSLFRSARVPSARRDRCASAAVRCGTRLESGRLLLLFTAAVPRPGLTRNGEVRIRGVIVEEIEDLLELARVWRERWRSCWRKSARPAAELRSAVEADRELALTLRRGSARFLTGRPTAPSQERRGSSRRSMGSRLRTR